MGHVEKRAFRVHCHVLWRRSDTFRPSPADLNQKINLTDHNPDCFEAYVLWLYHETFRFPIPVKDLAWERKWRFLWECYFMCEALAEFTFCDTIMDTITQAATSPGPNGWGPMSVEAFWSIVVEMVDTAYRSTAPASKARTFFVNIVIGYCTIEQVREFRGVSSQFLFEVLEAFVNHADKAGSRPTWGIDKCDLHRHAKVQNGESCPNKKLDEA